MSFPFGPQLHPDGTATFHLWAPTCRDVGLALEDRAALPMEAQGDGHFSLTLPAAPGTCYRFQLPDGSLRPDPASRFQPQGVHGPSALVDLHAHPWRDTHWRGLPKPDLLLYELHVGAFTPAGTYAAAIERLDELVDLGITAIEIMPLAQAGGGWNWGYDGVQFFAPHHGYGTPDELQALIDAAHQRGLAVLLDVVYNHFGPEGNYLHDFGGYVSKKHRTPWGDAPNFDGRHAAAARAWILENVRYWIEDFHFDGLRLDATHCIADHSDRHIVTEIGALCSALQQRLGRQIHLIAESNVYDGALLRGVADGGHGVDALWCDDFLNAVYAQLVPGEHRTHRQYQPHHDLETTLKKGYVFESTFQAEPQRAPGGESAALDTLISAIQHHDFIGNHPAGRRLHQVASPAAHRAAAALLLLFPTLPMLFMGEEFASDSPFLFFVDFADPHLRRAVEKGRRAEHPQHDWTTAVSPVSPDAFTLSQIGPAARGCATTRRWYQDLIRLRRQWRVQGLLSDRHLSSHWDADHHLAHLRYDNGVETAFAIVRLHPVGADVPDVAFRIEGEVLLHQCVKDTTAGPYAVLIGRGTATLLPS